MTATARGLCSGDKKLYVAGSIRWNLGGSQEAFLWTKKDSGEAAKVKLGDFPRYYFGKFTVCSHDNNGFGDVVYVAAWEKVWRVYDNNAVLFATPSPETKGKVLSMCPSTINQHIFHTVGAAGSSTNNWQPMS